MLSFLDAIGQHRYLFLILKVIETVVIMEIRLDMVMRLVSIDILNNLQCSGLPVVAKEEYSRLVLCVQLTYGIAALQVL